MKTSKISSLTVVLIAILLTALVLRIWGASFGLPFVYHADEGLEVNRALQLGAGEFDFSFFRMLKGGYFYLLFVEFGVLFIALKLFGIVHSVQDFAILYLRDPTAFYLVGRTTTAVIGTFSAYLLYCISKRIFSKQVGVIAALLLAVNVFHVVHSHYVTVDIPLSCLVLACLLFIVRIDETGSTADYFWASAFLGLATITKLPGILLIVPLMLVHLRRSIQDNGFSLYAVLNVRIALIGFVFCIVFFIANFGALLHFSSFLENVIGLFSKRSESNTDIEEQPFQYVHYMRVLYDSVDFPVLCLSFLGVLVVAWKRIYIALIFLLFGIVFFGVIGLPVKYHLVYSRYVLPIIPLIMLFAAIGISWLAIEIGKLCGRTDAILVFMCVLLSTMPIYASIKVDKQFLVKDSRTEAVEWFYNNVSEGSSVLIEGHTAKPINIGVQLRNSIENLQNAIREFELRGEHGKALYFQLEIKAAKPSDKRFNLHFYNTYDLEDWAIYAKRHPEYVVVRSHELLDSPKYGVAGEQFLQNLRLDSDYSRVASFYGNGDYDSASNKSGQKFASRGPDIEIYAKAPKDSSFTRSAGD